MLEKTIESEFGVPATVWRIASISVDYMQKSIEVKLFGYAGQQQAEEEKKPLAGATVTLPISSINYGPLEEKITECIESLDDWNSK